MGMLAGCSQPLLYHDGDLLSRLETSLVTPNGL